MYENPKYKNAIAIVGMACRFPGNCDTPLKYWDLLIENRDAITDIPSNRWDVEAFYDPNPRAHGKMYTKKGGFISGIDLFDADFFEMTRKEAQDVDPQQRLLLETSWEAIENANIYPQNFKKQSTGVFIGISSSDYSNLLASRGDPEELSVHFIAGKDLSAAAGRISYFLGLEGPSLAIDTATSSALVAIHYACKELLQGTCYNALAGGVNLILAPEPTIYRARARMLSPDGYCKSFDAKANGYTRAEGCGVIILKRLSDAIKDKNEILALIRGSAVRQDGSSKGFTAPNVKAQRDVIRLALSEANLNPKEIDYIEAHGTGTALGDPVEIQALNDVFENSHEPEKPLIIESVKNNIGHLEAASGIASVIKVILALKNEAIPRHIHFDELNPKIDLHGMMAEIPKENRPWFSQENAIRRAGISSFGLTGTNCHLILEESPKEKIKIAKKRDAHLFILSAKSKKAIADYIKKYLAFFERKPNVDLGNLCYTASTSRQHFSFRLAIIAHSLEDLIHKFWKILKEEEDAEVFIGEATQPIQLSYSTFEEESWTKLLPTLSRFYIEGFEIDWEHLNAPYASQKIHVPTYPFQQERFWSEILD